MARVRRKSRPAPRMRLNLEIVGIAALGLALLLGVALAAPTHSGAVGAAFAHALLAAFGRAAWLAPVLVALFGGIVFLEINVPKLILTFGLAGVCYFCIVDAAFGRTGGAFGRLLSRGLETLVGPQGATLVLALCAIAVTVWIGNVSVKRSIGSVIMLLARVRTTFAKAFAGMRARSAESRAYRAALPEAAVAKPSGPTSLREAFHLPASFAKPSEKPKRASKPIVPVDASAARVAAGTNGAPPASLAPETPIASHLSEAIDAASAASFAMPMVSLATIAPLDAKTFIVSEPPVGERPAPQPPPPNDPRRDAPDDDGYDPEDNAFDDDLDDDETFTRANLRRAVVGEYEPASVAAAAAIADGTKKIYALPSLELFDPPQAQVVDDSHRSQLLEDTLASFGVGAKVIHVQRGPSITRYELKPEKGIKISRITALADDIALALAATSVRIEAPIPGKSAVGIEVPNAQTSIVAIREILESLPQRGTVPPLHMALGKDITGRPVFGDLAKMPHLLVAGATGSGKSVCLNTIIASLLVSATPDQVQMLFIDPKRVELTIYNGIPHLVKEVITDARLAAGALFEMTKEMDSRYERFAKASVRKIEEYNAKFPEETLPYVVIVIDELADLMLIAPAKVETTICRLAQLARATGIHLVVATQRPSVDVITGIIKANIPSRIAFAVSSQVDSRTILDMVGAERLLGRGDMLFLPIDAPKPIRSQGALITNLEVERLVEFWATQARPANLLDVEVVPIEEDDKKREVDPLCYDAAQFIIQSDFASTAQLQQRFSIGHPRAVRVMKHLEEFGVVGPHEGTKPRRINIGLGELETIADRLGRSEQPELFSQDA